MANLTYVTGRVQSTNYVRVGHNSSAYNNDAVWSFTTEGTTSDAVFTLTWDNVTGGTGWSGAFDYVFAISTDSTLAQNAYSGTHIAKTVVNLANNKGTATVTFSGLSLAAGTYYLRANQNGTTLSTMKCFALNGNTVVLTQSSVNVNFNGAEVNKVTFNGVEVKSLNFNGTKIF